MPNEVKLLPCDDELVAKVRDAILKGAFNNDPTWLAMATDAARAAIEATRPTTVVTDEVVERPDLVKALWAIFMRIDTMPKSNKNMGLDVWTIKTLQMVRETIDLASMPTVVTGEQQGEACAQCGKCPTVEDNLCRECWNEINGQFGVGA